MNILFAVIVFIIAADFILERWLDYLNRKSMDTNLPVELTDVYNPDQYRKQQEYKRVNDKFATLVSAVNFVVVMLMLFLGGFALVDNWAWEITPHPVLTALVFFGILAFGSDLIGTPFAVYDTFVIEQRFGFNTTTPGTFLADKLKGWLLGAIIGGGIMALIVWLYLRTGPNFWLLAWGVATVFALFMNMFYTSLIVPLFNKQQPLAEGELRDAIHRFGKKVGFKLDNIFVIDGSKRSTKANAYFSGFGPKKRIVLYDTLIRDLSTDEIVAVLAHEIGHYKKHHVWIGLAAAIGQTGLTLFILSLLIDNPQLSKTLGGGAPSFHMGLLTFAILYSPISLLTGLLMNQLSRKNEFQADRFVKENGDTVALISALKKLSSKNLSNLTPHPAYVFFHYSHPTLLQRIKALYQDQKPENYGK